MVTGKTEAELRRTAETVFASMLHHAMRDTSTWAHARVADGRLDVEVNVPPRLRGPKPPATPVTQQQVDAHYDRPLSPNRST